MNSHPSLLEYTGAYNVSPKDYFGKDFDQSKLEPGEFLCNKTPLPDMSDVETGDITNAVNLVFFGIALTLGLSRENAKKLFGEIANLIEPFDRTIIIELDDSTDRAIVCEVLIKDIQRNVLSSRPLWRVLIKGECDSTAIIIYPKIVRVGSLSPKGNWIREIEKVNKQELDLIKKRTQFFDRQFVYVSSKLPSLLDISKDQPFKVAGRFDNYNGNFYEKCIWILILNTNKKLENIGMWSPDDNGRLAVSSPYFVDSKGAIETGWPLREGREYPFLLVQKILLEGFMGQLFMVEFIGDLNIGTIKRKWPLILNEKEMIKDVELVSQKDSIAKR